MHRTHRILTVRDRFATLLMLLAGLAFVTASPLHAQTAVPDSSAAPDSAVSKPVRPKLVKQEFGEGGPKIDMTRVNMDHGVPLSKNPTLAFTLSLVVPGAGQLYTHNYFKAVAFFGTDVGMILGLMQQNRLSISNGETADRLSDLEAPQYLIDYYNGLEDFYKNDRNKLIWWTAGVTLLSALDAYVEAHLFDFHIDPTLQSTPQGDGAQLGLSIRF